MSSFNQEFSISGRLVLKNTGLNIIGKAVPIIIGVVAIPFIIQRLGVEQFGILSLAWAVLGYFTIFDFGLGHAMTKFVAQALSEKKTDNLSQLIWGALLFSIGVGLLGTVMVAVFSSFLATRLFTISEELIPTAKTVFSIIAFGVPIMVGTSALRGALEGAQRYDLVNTLRILFNSLLFLIPVFLSFFGFGLTHIALFLVISQLGAFCGYFFFCFKNLPFFKSLFPFMFPNVMPLLRFGGWVAIANATLFLLAGIETFFIGVILSVKELGFYAPAAAIVARLLIFAESLIVLLPVFSALGGRFRRAAFFYERIFKHLLFGMGIVVLLFIFFANDILSLWLGEEFAEKSTTVLQLLSLGTLGLSLSVMTNSLIIGLGRPDILAKFRAGQMPVYFVLLWFFTANAGIDGAALAWTIRAIVDAVAVFLVSSKLLSVSPRRLLGEGIGRTLGILVLLGIAMAAGVLFWHGFSYFIFVGVLLVVFGFVWRYYVLDEVDKNFLLSIWRGVKL